MIKALTSRWVRGVIERIAAATPLPFKAVFSQRHGNLRRRG